MKLEEIKKKVESSDDEQWLIWCGYILNENDEEREIEYFGKFVKTKRQIIGIVRSMIDNTAPYRIIIQDTNIFKTDLSNIQAELSDFFPVEME